MVRPFADDDELDGPLVIVPPPLVGLPRSKARAESSKARRLTASTALRPVVDELPIPENPEPPIGSLKTTPSPDKGNGQVLDSTATSESQQPPVTPADPSPTHPIIQTPNRPIEAHSGSSSAHVLPRSDRLERVEKPDESESYSDPRKMDRWLGNVNYETLAEKLGAYAVQPTGITQMAAAAKRGQAGLSVGSLRKGTRGVEEAGEEHPLSEKSLKER